jgi:hypothetical protein
VESPIFDLGARVHRCESGARRLDPRYDQGSHGQGKPKPCSADLCGLWSSSHTRASMIKMLDTLGCAFGANSPLLAHTRP